VLRKKYLFFILLIVVCALVFSGCSQSTPAPATDKPSAPVDEPWPELIGLATGGVGSGEYAFSVAINTMINRYVDGVTAKEIPSTAPIECLRLMNNGEALLSFATAHVAYLANRGMEPYNDYIPYNLIVSGTPMYTHITVKEDSGITSIADLKGKTMAADFPIAPAHLEVFLAYVEAYGITKNDMKILSGADQVELARYVIEGMADGAYFGGPIPISAATELSTMRDTIVLGLDEDKIDGAAAAAVERGWFYTPQVLPAGTYIGQDKELNVLGSFCSYGCRPEANEKLMYAIVKALFENEKEFIELQPGNQKIKLDTALNDFSVPYHPGAIRYYREKGIWTAEHDDKQEALLAELGPDFAPHGFDPMN